MNKTNKNKTTPIPVLHLRILRNTFIKAAHKVVNFISNKRATTRVKALFFFIKWTDPFFPDIFSLIILLAYRLYLFMDTFCLDVITVGNPETTKGMILSAPWSVAKYFTSFPTGANALLQVDISQ